MENQKGPRKIKGKHLIFGGIAFFIIAKILYGIFHGIFFQSISTIAELTWFIFVGVGIIVILRERKNKKNINE
jgi:hypothetical protein